MPCTFFFKKKKKKKKPISQSSILFTRLISTKNCLKRHVLFQNKRCQFSLFVFLLFFLTHHGFHGAPVKVFNDDSIMERMIKGKVVKVMMPIQILSFSHSDLKQPFYPPLVPIFLK
jgi:hypothetical protein